LSSEYDEHPDWGGWGGRYVLYNPGLRSWYYGPETRPIWTNAVDTVLGPADGRVHSDIYATIWRWRSDIQNDFAARMDWCVQSYDEANHNPEARLNHSDRLTALAGSTVILSAEGSRDPDGDELTFDWIYYREAGTFEGEIDIRGQNSFAAEFTAPQESCRLHIILAARDTGRPPLASYRRVIVDVIEE
jgi:hypothetical protein